MLTLTDRAAVEAAIDDTTLDPQLRALLGARARQLEDDTEPDVELGELAHFHAVQPGDTLDTVEEALGMTFEDGPLWEWIEHHGSYYEAAFVVSDDGFGHILFVPDHADTDASILAFCKDHLTTA
jgi:hypothetical protein